MDEVNECRQRIAGIIRSVRSRQNKRLALFSQFEEQISLLKSSKDLSVYQATTKTIKDELKTCTLNELALDLKAENGTIAEKLAELQKCEKTLREINVHHGSLVERLVAGKMNKQQFHDTESNLIKKRDDTHEKINQLMSAL